MDKLKPCPFCGGVDLRNDGAYWGIGCRTCGAWMPAVVSTDKERSHSAADGWSRRSREQALESLLREALIAMRAVYDNHAMPHQQRAGGVSTTATLGPVLAAIDAALKEDHES